MYAKIDFLFQILKWILLGMTFAYLSVDCLNGLLIRAGVGFSLSQLFKMGMLIGMLLYMIGKNLPNFLISLGLILFFLIPIIVKSLISADTSTIVGNFGYNLKLILFPISFLFFESINDSTGNKKLIYKRFAWLNFFLIAINILLGVLGIGYSQYDGPEGGIGGRGFFFAGNEVAGIFVLFGGVCWYLTKSWTTAARVGFFFFLLVLGVLNTSKTAILGILLIIGLLEISVKIPNRISLGRLFGVLLFPLLIGGMVLLIYWGVQATGLVDRISFFYQRMDFLTFILSGRNQMVVGALSFYPSLYTFWDILFGIGYLEFLTLMGRFHGVPHAIEIDFFDLLFMNGLLGMGLSVGIYLIIMLRSWLWPSHLEKTPMWAINVILLLISLMAGHVFNSAMLGISLGFFNGLKILKE
jgi:hypothetical protein